MDWNLQKGFMLGAPTLGGWGGEVGAAMGGATDVGEHCWSLGFPYGSLLS